MRTVGWKANLNEKEYGVTTQVDPWDTRTEWLHILKQNFFETFFHHLNCDPPNSFQFIFGESVKNIDINPKELAARRKNADFLKEYFRAHS